jgi:hypothetical protein
VDRDRDTTWFIWGAAIVSLLLACLIVIQTVRTLDRTLTWEQARAEIIEARTYADGDDPYTCLTVRFRVQGDKQITTKPSPCSGGGDTGDHITVSYDPDDPEHASTNDLIDQSIIIILMLGGLILTAGFTIIMAATNPWHPLAKWWLSKHPPAVKEDPEVAFIRGLDELRAKRQAERESDDDTGQSEA